MYVCFIMELIKRTFLVANNRSDDASHTIYKKSVVSFTVRVNIELIHGKACRNKF
jgi:hypothetical protein